MAPQKHPVISHHIQPTWKIAPKNTFHRMVAAKDVVGRWQSQEIGALRCGRIVNLTQGKGQTGLRGPVKIEILGRGECHPLRCPENLKPT